MRATQSMKPRVAQTQRVTPKMVTAGMLLQMSSAELQLRIEEESAVNPALEIVCDATCPVCGRALSNGECRYCMRSGAELDARQAADDYLPSSLPGFPVGNNGDDAYDPIESTPATLTLQDYVLDQARLVVAERDFPIAEHLVADLNEDGLLETTVEEAASLLGVSSEPVERVLGQLQSLDPPGVCSRSVQECALIQLRELAGQDHVPLLAEPLLSRHWTDLANHSYARIERELHATRQEVEAAVAFIRRKLTPYPGRLYHSPYPTRREREGQAVRPDVIVQRDGADYRVEVVRPFDFELRVSAAYQRLAAQTRKRDRDAPEYRAALEQCRRATWLVQSLTLRDQTLRGIAEYIVILQRPFLDTESPEKMKRLTRTEVAKQIGKHPSTVSRAVTGKYVLLPSGNLTPFERFFSPAVAPKTIIADILAKEDPERPLTDEQICRILTVRGFQIARRTVAKYRLALRLPSSSQRGRH